ncbi:MAG: c-type cytochrome [Proteobacteria bacterium]|nr:c-type cytochrome [Pseudomonadota bacterium]
MNKLKNGTPLIVVFFLFSIVFTGIQACDSKKVPHVVKASDADVPAGAVAEKRGRDLYLKHCSGCHHEERYGLVGPPLLPEYFGRKKAKAIREIIAEGLPATNMPPFKDLLKGAELDSILTYIRTPLESPVWGMDDIRKTWETSYFSLEEKEPRFDMSNFFMIVEGGEGRVHFMDGDSFQRLGVVDVGAIHGGPKYGRDLRYAFAISRGGLLVKYDLYDQKLVGKIRGGISTRNIAVSSSGDYIAQANLLPKNLVIIDAFSMKPKEIIDPEGTPGAVYTLKTRGQFVLSIKDKHEILLIDDSSLDLRRISIDQPFTDFFIDPKEGFLIGTARGSDHFSVVDLDKGEVVKTFPAEGGMPHLASAAVWTEGGDTFAAFPQIGKPLLTVMKMYDWEVMASVKTKGAGFFARTHDKIQHIWVDTGSDTIQLIDKKTLKAVAEVIPQPGKRAMHIEFDKEGRHALVSVWEDEGEVVIYDTAKLEVKKRMPFKKPVGKYNATNKNF